MNGEKTQLQRVHEICQKDHKTWTRKEESKVYLWFYGPEGMEQIDQEGFRWCLVRYKGFADVQWAKLLISNFPTEENVEFIKWLYHPNEGKGRSIAHSALKKLYKHFSLNKQNPVFEAILKLVIAKGSRKFVHRIQRKMRSIES